MLDCVVVQLLNKVGKWNQLQLFCSSNYCVWWVLCDTIQSALQWLNESDCCLQILRVDDKGSVFQYLIHVLIIMCLLWMRNSFVWSVVRFDPQHVECSGSASLARLVWRWSDVSRDISIVPHVCDGSYDSSYVPPDSVVVSGDDVLLDATSVQNGLFPCSHYRCSSSGRHKSFCLWSRARSTSSMKGTAIVGNSSNMS